MNVQEEIFRSIENIARTAPSATMDYPTVITGEKGNGVYAVKIDGVERDAKDGIGLDLKIGTAVWVHAMNGNVGSLYIMCRR